MGAVFSPSLFPEPPTDVTTKVGEVEIVVGEILNPFPANVAYLFTYLIKIF